MASGGCSREFSGESNLNFIKEKIETKSRRAIEQSAGEWSCRFGSGPDGMAKKSVQKLIRTRRTVLLKARRQSHGVRSND